MRGSTAGLPEGTIEYRNNLHDGFLTFLDMVFASILIAPAVMAYWMGTWNLMIYILFPDDILLSSISSYVIGIGGHFLIMYFQDKISETFHPDKRRLTFMVFSRLYTEIYGIFCINVYRGAWELLNLYCPSDIPILVACTVIASILLVVCKGLRNISSSPFGVATDNSKDYFTVPTLFKTSKASGKAIFIMDCMFSLIVVGTLVVIVWRSLWVLIDLLLFPNDLILSSWASLAIGYGIAAIIFALQPTMKWICDRLNGLWRIAVCDAFLFASFVGTANVWRGVFQLIDLYIMSDNKVRDYLILHFAAFIFLAMLNCANSVIMRGVIIDADEPAGQCVVLPVHYVRLFFQKERQKKQRRLIDAIEKGELQTGLLNNSEKPRIVKYSVKSVEMTTIASNRPKVEIGQEKESYRNGD